jgi:hypothetical protein
MISAFPSADLDLAGLDTPAFPLDFNPELLLNEESTADDFHNWLQSELDILQDSPKAATDDVATEQPSAPLSGLSDAFSGLGQQQPSGIGMQAAPGIVELFQLQALAPGPNASQQAPWMEQQLLMQQQQQQLVQQQQQHQQLALQQQQQATQAFAAATAGMQLAMPQQPMQLQQQAVAADMMYQQQPYAMQYVQQLQPGLQQQQQYMYMPQPGLLQQQPAGSFVAAAAAAAAPQVMMQPMQHLMPGQPLQPFNQAILPSNGFAGMVPPHAWAAGMPNGIAAVPASSSGYAMQGSNGFLQVPPASMQQMTSDALLSPTDSSYLAEPSPTAAAPGAAGTQQQLLHARSGSGHKSRSKASGAAAAAAAVAGGAEKPKAPSRRFRWVGKARVAVLFCHTERCSAFGCISHDIVAHGRSSRLKVHVRMSCCWCICSQAMCVG